MKECVPHPTHGDVQLYENSSLSLSGRPALRPTDLFKASVDEDQTFMSIAFICLLYWHCTFVLRISYACCTKTSRNLSLTFSSFCGNFQVLLSQEGLNGARQGLLSFLLSSLLSCWHLATASLPGARMQNPLKHSSLYCMPGKQGFVKVTVSRADIDHEGPQGGTG